ncbi:zinc ribbon domain-containing protein [Paenibacillus larvae]|nr:zinc ribbon domain-containing protein [Paenibacillus larvae]MDT2294453.1 zinc ribbon domain-containing protein [Paenibacillus larvae]
MVKTARTSRKNAKNLHSWTFISFNNSSPTKANLVGIKIVEVNPAYTSQTCPASCGFNAHRDRVGARSIS